MSVCLDCGFQSFGRQFEHYSILVTKIAGDQSGSWGFRYRQLFNKAYPECIERFLGMHGYYKFDPLVVIFNTNRVQKMDVIGYKKIQRGFLLFSMDTLMITASFLLAYFLKKTVLFQDPHLDSVGYLKLYIIALPFLMGTLYASKLYTFSVLLLPFKKWLTILSRSVIYMYAVFIILSFYLKFFSYSRMVFTLFLFIVFPSLVLSRAIFSIISAKPILRKSTIYNSILYFTDRSEQEMRENLKLHLGCSVDAVHIEEGVKLNTLQTDLIRQGEIGGIMIDLDNSRSSEIAAILQRANKEGVSAYLSQRSISESDFNLSVESLGEQTMIAFNPSKIPTFGWILKRVLDLILTSILIILLSPVMVLIAFSVKLTSPGPAIFKQKRVGFGGGVFTMFKFRTMKDNAEADTGPAWASEDDGRVTRVGRLLRRTNLDELPQFFNVLLGDMSLVGPRPERPEFVVSFKEEIERYNHKHCVSPGITGLAQINGWRGNTSLAERIKCDLFYIDNWSLWIDLKILAITPFRAFRNAM